MVKIKMTPESLGKLKRAYAMAQIVKREGDEYFITGIEENLLSSFGKIIPEKSLAVRQVDSQPNDPQVATAQPQPAQGEPTKNNVDSQPNDPQVATAQPQPAQGEPTKNNVDSQPNDPPNTDIVKAMSKFVDQIAIAKSTEATKSIIEKYDKLETAEKLLAQRTSTTETKLANLEEKMAIFETAWQDERTRNELREVSNAEERKKSAENVAAITQHLKNIPLPK